MKFLKNIFRLFWRLWFYAWVVGTIAVILPLLVVLVSYDRFYKTYFKFAIAWGKTILFVMGFKAKTIYDQEIDPNKSYMFIANHTSLIDIMLMLAVMKNPGVFVGKKELKKLPIFGYIFRKTSIMVDRSSPKSRKEVFDSARKKIEDGLSIVFYPEGLVPPENVVMSDFKNGAFRLAIEHELEIVPMTFYDCKQRLSWTFFSGGPGELRVKVNRFIQTKGLTLKDLPAVKEKAYTVIYNNLINDKAYMLCTNKAKNELTK